MEFLKGITPKFSPYTHLRPNDPQKTNQFVIKGTKRTEERTISPKFRVSLEQEVESVTLVKTSGNRRS